MLAGARAIVWQSTNTCYNTSQRSRMGLHANTMHMTSTAEHQSGVATALCCCPIMYNTTTRDASITHTYSDRPTVATDGCSYERAETLHLARAEV